MILAPQQKLASKNPALSGFYKLLVMIIGVLYKYMNYNIDKTTSTSIGSTIYFNYTTYYSALIIIF